MEQRVFGVAGYELVGEGEGIIELACVFECAQERMADGGVVGRESEGLFKQRHGGGGVA